MNQVGLFSSDGSAIPPVLDIQRERLTVDRIDGCRAAYIYPYSLYFDICAFNLLLRFAADMDEFDHCHSVDVLIRFA